MYVKPIAIMIPAHPMGLKGLKEAVQSGAPNITTNPDTMNAARTLTFSTVMIPPSKAVSEAPL